MSYVTIDVTDMTWTSNLNNLSSGLGTGLRMPLQDAEMDDNRVENASTRCRDG